MRVKVNWKLKNPGEREREKRLLDQKKNQLPLCSPKKLLVFVFSDWLYQQRKMLSFCLSLSKNFFCYFSLQNTFSQAVFEIQIREKGKSWKKNLWIVAHGDSGLFSSTTHSSSELCGGELRCVVWWRFELRSEGCGGELLSEGAVVFFLCSLFGFVWRRI